MDLGRYTPQQRDSITYEGGHLFIEAGAGTGKTATLTAKVAYLMQQRNALAFEHISDLLAITFTDKAASELTGRIRSALRSQGLTDEALLVDDAWISTIHGMCSRILKDHAFELGIDPTFSVVSNLDSDELLQQAILTAISGDGGIRDDATYDPLFVEYGVALKGKYPDSFTVPGILDRLIVELSTLPHGADDLYLGPDPLSALDIARGFREALSRAIGVYSVTPGLTTKMEENLAADRQILEQVERICERGADDEACVDELTELLSEKPITCGKRTDEVQQADGLYRAEYADLQSDLCQLLAWPYLQAFIGLAVKVGDLYSALKAERGVLDNGDLLMMLYRAFELHPEIARTYAERFRLIMIDEFQDTDALQIGIARMLDELGAGELVTVGDAQQSIYRFRGADVNLFRRFDRELPADAKHERLDRNFRSHADVLAFVNAVFGADEAFGERYLSLKVQEHRCDPAFPDGVPHIDMVLVASGYGGGVRKEDRIVYEASAIAQRFAVLRDAGWRPSEMVVLLGTMSKSAVYSDALRAAGFEVVITGGSVFWTMPEPVLVNFILRFLANPYDNEAAYQVLESPLASLSSDELSILATDEEGVAHSLYQGLVAAWRAVSCEQAVDADGKGADDTGRALDGAHAGAGAKGRGHAHDRGDAETIDPARITPRIAAAAHLLCGALSQVGTDAPSSIVLRACVESGWIARMEADGAQGSASCANLLKSVRKVRELEGECPVGMALVARAFEGLIGSTPKEQPGSLVAQGREAVRIMTIHSSKGLEFPIVALAEFAESEARKSGGFLLTSVEGRMMASLSPKRSLDKSLGEAECDIEGPITREHLEQAGISRGRYHRRLLAYSTQEEAAEKLRLFYVGATRAREALIIATNTHHSKSGLKEAGVLGHIARLFEGGALPMEDVSSEYGGSAPMRYTYMDLVRGDDGEVSCSTQPSFELCRLEAAEPVTRIPVLFPVERPNRDIDVADDGIREFSYSSIAPHREPDTVATGKPDSGRSGSGKPGSGRSTVVFDELTDEPVGEPADELEREAAFQMGLAFHRTAEYLVLEGALHDGRVEPLDQDRIDRIAAHYELSPRRRERYLRALDTWMGSDIAAEAAGWPHLRAEVPFLQSFASDASGFGASGFDAPDVPAAQGAVGVSAMRKAYLDGEIDLLCTDDAGRNALIVDYKTGGTDEETPEALLSKHRLQALCYTEAVLAAGIEHVELAFVRVERTDADGQPQVVRYAFDAADAQAVHDEIARAGRESGKI